MAVSSTGYERKTCSALGEGWMTMRSMRRECACRFSVNVRLRLDGFPSHALLHACYDFSRRGPSLISFYTPSHPHHFHRIWSVRISHPATTHAPARPNASPHLCLFATPLDPPRWRPKLSKIVPPPTSTDNPSAYSTLARRLAQPPQHATTPGPTPRSPATARSSPARARPCILPPTHLSYTCLLS
jgi:hypothetical protein